MNLLPREKVLYTGPGLYSAVKVTKNGSRVNLFTGDQYLQSSFDFNHAPTGTVFDWYLAAPWFSGSFDGCLGSMLILGLGAGAQVKLFNQTYEVKKIVGVEIDPLIIDLGKKYFDLNDSNLEIIQGDVITYRHSGRFDLIILDAFRENKFVDLSGLSILTDRGVLVINRVLGDVANRELEKDLVRIFTTVYALKVINNVFYICTNSDEAPRSSTEVKKILNAAAKSNKNLDFLKSFRSSNLHLLW